MLSNLSANDPTLRFLLRKSRWNTDEYQRDKISALQEAIQDLDPNNDNISVFRASLLCTDEGLISDFEIIAFLFSASCRTSCQDLFYSEIPLEKVTAIGLHLRKNEKTANLSMPFYSNRHYEIYGLDDKKRKQLAEIIFDGISQQTPPNLPRIPKRRITEIGKSCDQRLKGVDLGSLHSWAQALLAPQ